MQVSYKEYDRTLEWMLEVRDSENRWRYLAALGCPAPCVQTYYHRQPGVHPLNNLSQGVRP